MVNRVAILLFVLLVVGTASIGALVGSQFTGADGAGDGEPTRTTTPTPTRTPTPTPTSSAQASAIDPPSLGSAVAPSPG